MALVLFYGKIFIKNASLSTIHPLIKSLVLEVQII